MNLRRIMPKALILLSFALIILGAFLLVSGFFELDYGRNSVQNSDQTLISASHPVGYNPPGDVIVAEPANIFDHDHDDYDCDCLFELNLVFDYELIPLNDHDISRGNLILINHEHSYIPPDESIFISVRDWQRPSFRTQGDVLLHESIIRPFIKMMDAFYAEVGTDQVAIISGFRGIERQRQILDENIARMGEAEARRWVSEPGHSEHHSGLAMDLGFYQDGAIRTFLGVGRTAWFSRNSYRFGFILRYPENKFDITGIAHEPWHFRYVGLPHAYFIHQNNLVLEQYIAMLTEHDRNNPFLGVFNGFEYEIFFTQEPHVMVPFDSDVDVSGTNIDGFIVTVRP